MSKTPTPKTTNTPTTRTPNICDSFSGNPGDPVIWQNVPAGGCTIVKDGTNPWPFTPGPPIILPLPPVSAPVKITAGLTPRPYTYIPECCTGLAIKTVTVG
jgi:hypothetical protein